MAIGLNVFLWLYEELFALILDRLSEHDVGGPVERQFIANDLVGLVGIVSSLLPSILLARAVSSQAPSVSSATLGGRRVSFLVAAATLVGGALWYAIFGLNAEVIEASVVAKVNFRAKVLDVLVLAFNGGMEECFYRGSWYGLIRREYSASVTILATSVAFAVVHPLDAMPTALVLGLAFGVVREGSGSVTPSICLHMIWNAMVTMTVWQLW